MRRDGPKDTLCQEADLSWEDFTAKPDLLVRGMDEASCFACKIGLEFAHRTCRGVCKMALHCAVLRPWFALTA